jgi:hypothetical protein
MKNILAIVAVAFGAVMVSAPAFAAAVQPLPEPISFSLVAGGMVALAAVKRMRRK